MSVCCEKKQSDPQDFFEDMIFSLILTDSYVCSNRLLIYRTGITYINIIGKLMFLIFPKIFRPTSLSFNIASSICPTNPSIFFYIISTPFC
jgi:hypothetical protein